MIQYNDLDITALEAMEKAQWIAFAPAVFQAARALRNFAVLAEIEKRPGKGLSLSEIEEICHLSHYGARVLCEAGLAIGLLYLEEERYLLTKTGCFFISDELTDANCDFINDVCYQGLFSLEDSIRKGKPEGLNVFGNWPTVYEALSHLPPKVQESWFKFDHYYSDQAFENVLSHLFKLKPCKILDIGGNTGKFAFQCLGYSKDVEISIMDLSGQLAMAKRNAINAGFDKRMSFIEANVLNESQLIPAGYDVIWMSQFLDCFSDDQIISILTRCRKAIDANSRICILEPFWDRQQFRASAFSLMMISLYFTTIANGNSQMYHSQVFEGFVKATGLKIEKRIDGIGVCHTLLICKTPS